MLRTSVYVMGIPLVLGYLCFLIFCVRHDHWTALRRVTYAMWAIFLTSTVSLVMETFGVFRTVLVLGGFAFVCLLGFFNGDAGSSPIPPTKTREHVPPIAVTETEEAEEATPASKSARRRKRNRSKLKQSGETPVLPAIKEKEPTENTKTGTNVEATSSLYENDNSQAKEIDDAMVLKDGHNSPKQSPSYESDYQLEHVQDTTLSDSFDEIPLASFRFRPTVTWLKDSRKKRKKKKQKAVSTTELCILLFMACVLVTFIQLLPWLILWGLLFWFIKHIIMSSKVFNNLKTSMRIFIFERCSKLWEVFLPHPLLHLWNFFTRGDAKFVDWIYKKMDLVVAVLIILLLVFGTILLAVFFGFKFHEETTHLVSYSTQLWHQKGKQHVEYAWRNVMGGQFDEQYNEFVNTTLDMCRNWVQGKGRIWVEHQLAGVTGQHFNLTHLERHMDSIWGAGQLSNGSHAQLLNWNAVRENMFDAISSGGLTVFFHENLETLQSILSSIYGQLTGSFSLVIWWILTTVWTTSTSFFNFIFSMILFFTALFYLLSSSDEGYKPFKWFLFIFPEGPRETVEEAISQAIKQVFQSYVKIAVFHGLWCWLTMALLGVKIVYISTMFTMITLLLPIIGTYWVCIPASMELWLISGKPVHAIVLFVLQFIASWVVDPQIYGEIQGSHHYVIGLSVVGGMYFLGFEGVLVGPLLCCVLFILYKVLTTTVLSNQK
ncbi:Transmembrane protein 245 (Fragment), variant 3 [Balamuthia mandrillaris]